MGVVLGFNCKFYRNTGTYGSPTWDLIPQVKDVDVPIEFTEVDVSRRAGGGFKESEPGLCSTGFDFELLEDTTDTDYTTIRDAALARTSIEFLALNGLVATAGSTGLRATCKLFKMAQSQKLDDATRMTFTAKPCYAANAPSWFTAS